MKLTSFWAVVGQKPSQCPWQIRPKEVFDDEMMLDIPRLYI
jgi:hypothetical protein